MPLASQSIGAKAIIAKLEQPHRFDYVLLFKDGFQHHDFDKQDAVNLARSRMAARFAIDPAKVDENIIVCDERFMAVGGMDYDLMLAAYKNWEARIITATPATLVPEPVVEQASTPTPTPIEPKIENQGQAPAPTTVKAAQNPAPADSNKTIPQPKIIGVPPAKPAEPAKA